jgi:uncharacterized heparinase superfamily protein
MKLKHIYKRGRQYSLTMSRMSTRQIVWRLRNIALRQWWRFRPRKSPQGVSQLPFLDLPRFGYTLPLPAGHPVLRKAEAVNQGRFTFLNQTIHFDGCEPDWFASPDGDRLWTYNLHYFEYGRDLLWAYRSTEQSHYLVCLMDLIQHWITVNPFWTAVAWEPYTISKRLIAWSTLLGYLHDDSIFRQECLPTMFASMVQQAQFLAKNVEYDVDNNHLITNACALVTVAIYLSQGSQTSQWYRQGMKLLQEQIARQILEDGGHCERSLSYQMVVLQDILELALLFKQAGKPIPPELDKAIGQLHHFLLALVKPDGTIPMLNDTVPGYPMPVAELLLVSAAYLHEPLPAFVLPDSNSSYYQWIWGKPYFATSSLAKIPVQSTAFTESGYFIMRNDEIGNSSFLVFDCGPIGPPHSAAHAHADTLSFELAAYGQTLICDPGVYEYKAGPWRDYFRSTAAHNSITVDGEDQSVFWGSFRVAEIARARLIQWETNQDYDYVEGEHDGYTRLGSPVVHRRSLRFVKPNKWIVRDTLTSGGKDEHAYQLRFHLAASALVQKMTETGCRINFPEGVTLHVQTQHPPDTAVSLKNGWLSATWKQKVAIPVLHYSLTTSAPIAILETVLVVSQERKI